MRSEDAHNFQDMSVSPETIFLDNPITSASYKVRNFLSSGFGLFPWDNATWRKSLLYYSLLI